MRPLERRSVRPWAGHRPRSARLERASLAGPCAAPRSRAHALVTGPIAAPRSVGSATIAALAIPATLTLALAGAVPLALGLVPVTLPLTRLEEISVLSSLIEYPPVKALLPIPVLLALSPVVIWFFGRTWRALDREARGRAHPPGSELASSPRRASPRWLVHSRARGPRSAALRSACAPSRTMPRGAASSRHRPGARRLLSRRGPRLERRASLVRGPCPAHPLRGTSSHPQALADSFDYRPAACLLLVAIILTLQDYYGGRPFYRQVLQPILVELEANGMGWLQTKSHDELWGYAWWSTARVVGYVLPFPLWLLLFPKDNLLDFGLRLRGLLQHAWIYGLCLCVVVPTVLYVASQPDFNGYYPFYKHSSRSWFDFWTWEALYWAQFLALEMFFRGFMLGALRRSLGAAAIFVMVVPYCMIHYGKPYLEAQGAIVAGVVLGSLAMHTRSIYSGFLLHVTVAFLMDFLALWHRNALPRDLWPGG